jgi:hypothetical protein
MLAGHAVFTVEVPAEAQVRADARPHYTYKVRSFVSSEGEPLYSVAVLTDEYQYIGMLNPNTGAVKLTKATKLTDEAPAVKLIRWVLGHLFTEKALPAAWKLHHEGRCAACGRQLTTPESIERGFGPECWARNV